MAEKLGARKEQKFMAIGVAPSLNKTPRGPSTPVVPYPVFFDLSNSEGTASNVKLNGCPAYLLDQSTQPHCRGDEQGTAGGIRSGTFNGEIRPVSASSTVKVGGKPVVREGDQCTLNAGNCPGIYVATSEASPLASKQVWVTLKPSRPVACPYHPMTMEAVGTPSGGTFEWSLLGEGELVNDRGVRVKEGQVLNLWTSYGDTAVGLHNRFTKVMVSYHHPEGDAVDVREIPIDPLNFEVAQIGTVHQPALEAYPDQFLEEDMKSVVREARLGNLFDVVKDKQAAYNFKGQRCALIIIPGMANTDDTAAQMQYVLNELFMVTDSALIPNITHGHGAVDVLKTSGFEFSHEVDRVSVLTAAAICRGLDQKGEVYVVAHSQGTAIFERAMEYIAELHLLEEGESKKIHYQGFGSETFIHQDTYDLGSARNVRNDADRIPLLGDAAKFASGSFRENLSLDEKWERVNSPVPHPWRQCACLPLRHNFINNYLEYVKVPRAGHGAPDFCRGLGGSTSTFSALTNFLPNTPGQDGFKVLGEVIAQANAAEELSP